jgi:hypothetical protein
MMNIRVTPIAGGSVRLFLTTNRVCGPGVGRFVVSFWCRSFQSFHFDAGRFSRFISGGGRGGPENVKR